MKRKGLNSYYGFLVVLAVCLGITVYMPSWGRKIFAVAFQNTLFMLGVIPPIFVLTGLFDVWVPKEKVIKKLGDASGWLGIGIAVALGAFAAGPLYAAFPVAEVLLKKGVSLRNVWVFLGAWSTMKIPMLLFEAQSLGVRFALTRYGMSFGGVLVIAFLLERLVSLEEQNEIRTRFSV
ncbi:MAG: permease [Atribacterota bacterium]